MICAEMMKSWEVTNCNKINVPTYICKFQMSLCAFFMTEYLLTEKYSKCMLFGRLLDVAISSLISALSTFKYTQRYSARDGVVD